MSSRQQFLLPNVTPGTLVRLDTVSGSTSPADVVDNLNHSISGALITADGTGRIASGDVYGPVGVTTLYLKTLDGSNNVTGTTTLTSSHAAPSSPGTSLPDQTGNAGKVLGTDGSAPEWVDSGGSSPVPANATGASTGTLTPDPISGSDTATVIVVPADCTILAVQLEGDTHPRMLINADPGDFGFVCLGDGTSDPTPNGIGLFNGKLSLFAAGGGVNIGPTVTLQGKVEFGGDSTVQTVSSPGTVTGAVEIFNSDGTSRGFIPVYDAIT